MRATGGYMRISLHQVDLDPEAEDGGAVRVGIESARDEQGGGGSRGEHAERDVIPAGATGWHAINLGTGKGFSVLEMVRVFEKASGREVPYEIVARRAGDVAACYANPNKAGKCNIKIIFW